MLITLAVLSAGGMMWFARSRSHAHIDAFRADVRARGGVLAIRQIEPGLFTDVLRDVRFEPGRGTVVDVPEVRVSHQPLGAPGLRAPRVRVTLQDDPVSSFSKVSALFASLPAELEIGRVTVDYRHRSVGRLVIDGVSRASSAGPWALSAEQLHLGRATWSNATLSMQMRNRTLQVRFGSEASSAPRATASYVPSDGRAAEWRIDLPHQSLAELRPPLGLGSPPVGDRSRIAGVLSWVVPDDAARAPRGSFRFILDQWYQPSWPEANVLVGSSGSLAAVVVPTPDEGGLRLQRVEVSAALFGLEGSGTITLAEQPRLTIDARGRRTCTELARLLPASRYRDTVRASLGLTSEATPLPTNESAPRTGPATDYVELALSIHLTVGARGALRFSWRLSPGCGLDELVSQVDGTN